MNFSAVDFAEPETWVLAGLILFFIVLVLAKVPGQIVGALDAKINGIKNELAEAERLRNEAQSLLNQIKMQKHDADRQAAALIAGAHAEASRLEAEAKARVEEQIARRESMAQSKIAQAEADAIAFVKAVAVDRAAAVAEMVLTSQITGAAASKIIDADIAEVGKRLLS